MSQPLWQIDGRQARLAIDGELSGAVDLLRPGDGLQLRSAGGEVVAFAVDLPPIEPDANEPQLDAWVRGGDLVATYEQTERRRTRGQIYWRVHRCGAGTATVHALDLIVSVQTSLLDSEPGLSVRSRVAANGVLRLTMDADEVRPITVSRSDSTVLRATLEPACFLFRLGDGAGTYVEMVHPSDFTQSALRVGPDGRIEVSHRLFQGRLEKGVILRSRLRAVFLPSAGDAALARACYAEFAASEPPLTT